MTLSTLSCLGGITELDHEEDHGEVYVIDCHERVRSHQEFLTVCVCVGGGGGWWGDGGRGIRVGELRLISELNVAASCYC